jgi:hypothetical protein
MQEERRGDYSPRRFYPQMCLHDWPCLACSLVRQLSVANPPADRRSSAGAKEAGPDGSSRAGTQEELSSAAVSQLLAAGTPRPDLYWPWALSATTCRGRRARRTKSCALAVVRGWLTESLP